MWITSCIDTIRTPTVVALGNFDGIHQGHRCVIEPILLASRPERVVSSRQVFDATEVRVHPTVVTFNPHPQEFFTGQRRQLLTPLDEKASYLSKLGVEQLVLLPFDQALANLTPKEFVETVLVQQLKAQFISVGQDFCFGRQRSGTTTDLQAIAQSLGIQVQIVPLHTDHQERISSSAIRQALQQGNVVYANRLLGRPYVLIGQVVKGQQLGRQLGFPTANLQLPSEKFLPKLGVYGVRVSLSGGEMPHLPGVMNVGYRPTVNGMNLTVEVHLLDWSGDLYDKTVTVSLEAFLRGEQKFLSLDDLKAQIQTDCAIARSILLTSQPA